jgi:hypothetical protein
MRDRGTTSQQAGKRRHSPDKKQVLKKRPRRESEDEDDSEESETDTDGSDSINSDSGSGDDDNIPSRSLWRILPVVSGSAGTVTVQELSCYSTVSHWLRTATRS